FRGEALASIAAVAQVELRTRTLSDDVGTFLRMEGSVLKEQSKVNVEQGTNIAVKNLFFNTPGRRNFLKSDRTELKNITEVVTRMAVMYPEVGWHYVSDDEILLDLKPGSMEDRFIDVFGERHFRSVVKLREETDFLSVEGFIGKPDFARKSRADQYLYINRRFIVNRTVSHAVFHAFEHLMVKNSFPFFVLNLTIDPRKVDVNVHPSKMEVKFENESNIYRFVVSVIRKTLAANDLIPSVSFRQDEAVTEFDQRLRFSQSAVFHRESMTAPAGAPSDSSRWSTPLIAPEDPVSAAEAIDLEKLFSKIEQRMTGETPPVPTQQTASFSPKEKLLPHQARQASAERDVSKDSRAIWQVHNKYILSQIRTGLLIVDQHVAHERILYERALANFEKDLPSSQQLLFPQTVQLGAHDYT
ncbi:MAG: DNA mismatch repair endonuclease MutL, partial [Bacteroidota bacterium]